MEDRWLQSWLKLCSDCGRNAKYLLVVIEWGQCVAHDRQDLL